MRLHPASTLGNWPPMFCCQIAPKSGRVVLPRHRVPVAWNVRTDVMAAIPHNAHATATSSTRSNVRRMAFDASCGV
jgi:hypothetical protein